MFFKSAAKRNATPPTTAPAAPAAAATGPLTVESLGRQLREVLPTRRLQSISLCDHEANVLWLSEGALGPDEHSMVTEALALLSADTSLPCHETGLEDGRLALFLPVRAPNGEPVGIAMILADRKSVSDDTLERMTAAPVRAIMQRLAVLLKPSERRASGSTARLPLLQLADEPEVAEAVPPAARVAPVAAAAALVAPSRWLGGRPDHQSRGDRRHPGVRSDCRVPAPAPRQEIPAMPRSPPLEPESPSSTPRQRVRGPPDMLDLDFEPALPKGPAARGTVRRRLRSWHPSRRGHPRRRPPRPQRCSVPPPRAPSWYPSRPRSAGRAGRSTAAPRWPPSPATRTSCSSCCRT